MCKDCGYCFPQYNTLQTKCARCTVPIKTRGKNFNKWQAFRRQWKKDNPSPYYCGICEQAVRPSELVLDHIIPRSRAPHLRYITSNIQPAHSVCNYLKGSKV